MHYLFYSSNNEGTDPCEINYDASLTPTARGSTLDVRI